MNRQNRNIGNRSFILQGNNSRKSEVPLEFLNSIDYELFEQISDLMKGAADIEDVKNDPHYSDADEIAGLLSAGVKKTGPNLSNRQFIRDSLGGRGDNKLTPDDITVIRHEINKNNLDKITAEWVKDWHEKRQNSVKKEQKIAEIKEFITESLKPEEENYKVKINQPVEKRKGISRTFIPGFLLTAAAMLAGAIIVFRSLVPVDNPEKLYSKFYEPLKSVSLVTRGVAAAPEDPFSLALEDYKTGKYRDALAGFSAAHASNSNSAVISFYSGLAELALDNTVEAVKILEGVSSQPGEYTKDARWYQGLAYLKTGDKEKASECFEYLAMSPGFYRGRSEKILRRLR